MNRTQIKKEQVICKEGIRYKLKAYFEKNKLWQMENMETGILSTIAERDLLEGHTFGSIIFMGFEDQDPDETKYITRKVNGQSIPHFFDMFDAEERSRAEQLKKFFDFYFKTYGDCRSRKVISKSLDEDWPKILPDIPCISESTAYRCLVSYINKAGSIESFIKRHDRKGNRTQRLPDMLLDLCEQAIDEIYMTRKRETKQETHDRAILLVNRENKNRRYEDHLPRPTNTTIKRLIDNRDPYEVDKARYGADYARHKHLISVGSASILVDAPLQRWEIDHTQLNLVLVDNNGMPIDRPWLTVIIDRFSRMIMGFWLTFHPPSHATLAKCLKFAMLSKAGLVVPGMHGTWDTFGIPALIAMDNGFEFHGNAFENACYDLLIDMMYCPRKQPWWKAVIERYLGTLNRSLGNLSPGGKTYDNIKDKADENPLKTAQITEEMAEQAITRWIVDIYHEKKHRELGVSPRVMWETHINRDLIQVVKDPAMLDAVTGNIDKRLVQHYGIEINTLKYNSMELGKMRHLFKGKATIRWNEAEMGMIYVMVPDGTILPVPVIPDQSWAVGIDYYSLRKIRDELRDRGEENATADRIIEIKEQLRTDMQEHGKEMLKKQRKTKYLIKQGLKKSKQAPPVQEAQIPTPASTKRVRMHFDDEPFEMIKPIITNPHSATRKGHQP